MTSASNSGVENVIGRFHPDPAHRQKRGFPGQVPLIQLCKKTGVHNCTKDS